MKLEGSAPQIWSVVQERAEEEPEASTDLWERLGERIDRAELRPKLLPDVEIKEFRLRRGNDYIMVANPRDLLHYRLTPRDAELLRLMDGTRSVKEIVVAQLGSSGDLDLSAAIDLVRLLYEGNFLETPYVDVDSMVGRALDPATDRRRKAREFGRTLSIEWKNADRLVSWLYRRGLKIFFRRWAAALCVALALFGFGTFITLVRGGRFTIAGKSLAIGFFVLLALDYLMVFVHELGHALVVVKNGRRIKSAGFQIYFGSPAFFVDSSDGMMMSKHQQILESFAGPFAQLVLAGLVSVIAWRFPDWALSETLFRFAVLNYIVVIMNLIPLLELDGYYIFADLIEMPDLRERSLSFMRNDLLHKIRARERFSRRDVGLSLYWVVGALFTVFSFYTAYFYWRTVFGDFIGRLWDGGPVTRLLLLVLAIFVTGPIVRGFLNVLRSIGRRVRAMWRRIAFRLETKWRVEAAELIDALPAFHDVPVEVLNDLAGRVQLRTFALGQPVFRQGDRATAFYVVRKGAFDVIEHDPESGQERSIRSLVRGDSFGELGLLNAAPRAATIRAAGEAEVFEIDKSTFDHFLADLIETPSFAPTLQNLSELRELPCFAALSNAQVTDLLEHGGWLTFSPGQEIIRQGDVGDSFYAISSGQVEVFEDEELVRTMGPGSYFGEIALLTDVPRTATVAARTPVRAFRLDREGFDRLVSDGFRRGALVPSVPVNATLAH